MFMNLLALAFKQLYKEDSVNDIGTMKCEQIRISRTNVDPDVRKAYDNDRDFFISFVDSYITEAVLHFFGMEDIYSAPTRHVPPDIGGDVCAWMYTSFKQLIDELVAPNMSSAIKAMQGNNVIGKYL